MQYIFLDESGDLGFKPSSNSSKYFVISILFTEDKKPLERVAKKVHKMLKKKVKKLSGGVLHCYKEKPATRKRLLHYVNKQNCKIMNIWLNKSKVYTKIQNEKHVLYNYLVNILLDRIMTREYLDIEKPIILVASKRETNRFLNVNFKDYLEKQLKRNHSARLSVEIKTPAQEKSLQVVDFITWSIFRKYEREDETYFNIFKGKVVEERGLFE